MKRVLTMDAAAVDWNESRSLAKGFRILDALAAAATPVQLKDLT